MIPIHPSMGHLLRLQAAAKVRRMWLRMRAPRRLVLSCVAVLLAAVWLGNAAITILLREGTTPERLASMLTFGLLAYAFWHVFRVACYRPEEPIEWTSAEREILRAAPLRHRDLLGYRLASVVSASFLKAGCVAVLLLPDLPNVLLGFVGLLLVLLFLDLVRMAMEMTAWGMPDRGYWLFRGLVFALATTFGACGVLAFLRSDFVQSPQANREISDWIDPLVAGMERWSEGWMGAALQAPFRPFVELLSAAHLSLPTAAWGMLSVTLVVGSGALLLWLYPSIERLRQAAEQAAYPSLRLGEEAGRSEQGESASAFHAAAESGQRSSVVQVPRMLGLGPIAWRQTLGAWNHAGGLLVALAVPAVLACLPLAAARDDATALLAVVAALGFYSFLLLPTALKFDFRRDLDYLAVLAALPIRPTAVVLGQLVTPVVITFLLQAVVLGVALFVRPIPPAHVAGALLLLLPMNVLIFALENLLFLMYPCRLTQEGIEVFLRTTLMFTAKGLLFTVALAGTIAWSLAAGTLAQHVSQLSGLSVSAPLLLFAGSSAILCVLSAVAIGCLIRVYHGFDPSQDVPA